MQDRAELVARIADLEADNRRLRRLLEQQNAPGELRHRLRNTLAQLRSLIRKSSNTPRSLEAFAAHLDDRVDALAQAQLAIDQYGAVDLHRLIADELLRYGLSEGGKLTLSGPPVELEPRVGQAFALAIHELAVNAVEHGELGSGGRLAVAWSLADQGQAPRLTLVWKELDVRAPAEPTARGFGSEVLTRLLPYEWGAVTSLSYQPDGLRCEIQLPLPQPNVPGV